MNTIACEHNADRTKCPCQDVFECNYCGGLRHADEFTPDITMTMSCCFDCRADQEERRLQDLKTYVVCVWRVHRYYGGPEEGGWWYDQGSLVEKMEFNNPAAARKAGDALEIEYPPTKNRYSVTMNASDYVIMTHERGGWGHDDDFDYRGEKYDYFPLERPRYE